MTPEERLVTCCVIKCLNTPKNSNVTFFSFPAVRCRSYQRNKWVHAIKNKNGRWWMPTLHSVVCSDHFVQGQPSTNTQDTDFVPSMFTNKRKGERIQSRAVSVKKFALEYIKHDALLEKPTRAGARTERKRAYQNLAAALGIPVTMVRSWERRFREYFEEKMADPPENRMPFADGKPHWLTTVANRLHANPIHRLTARGSGGAVSPGGVVAALCAAARARGTLCSTALYNDVRRVLRLSSAINDLHAIWVSAQRVSVQQVVVAGRAGDAAHAAPPPAAVEVADLVLLHTDVDILTEESITLYEESAALHTLWQLIQRHRLEDAAPAHSRVRAQRWTRAHRAYLDSGRKVSLVVLQRRWYELKEQARIRLSMHWRRPQAPQLVNDLTSAPDPAPDPAPEPAPDPAPTSHELYPRPAPLHIAILKRYPHIATKQFRSWRQLVLEGTIVTEPLEEENDVTETQSNNNEQFTGSTDTGNDAAVNQLYTNISNAEQPTFDEPMVEQTPDSDLLIAGPTYTDRLEENDVKETKSNINEQTTARTDTGVDFAAKQLYPNMSKVEEPTFDKSKNEQTFYNVPFVKQSTADDHLAEHTTDSVRLSEKPTVHEPKIEQPIDRGSLTDNHVAEQTTDTDLLVMQRTVDDPLPEQTTDTGPLAVQDPLPERTTDTGLLHVQSTIYKSKIEQAMDYDISIDQSTVRTLAESPGGHAGNAATADIQDMLDTLDTKGGPDISSKHKHRAEDKSNEVIPPIRAYSSDTDTDTEDNLVIDEFSNKTPCSLKLEPVPHIQTHSSDTLLPYVALQDSARTIEVLKMLDPNTVKTEILFESDEDDFESCNEVDKDKIELNATKEMSFINNRIIFVDEDPRVSCDVKSKNDFTGRMDWKDEQEMEDPVNETPTIDHKLLMDTKVRLFRIDKIRAWKSNVRKDNSIRVSRIHRRYYTPKHKYVCNNPKARKQDKRWDVELRTLARLATNNTTTDTTATAATTTTTTATAATTTTTSETQEIRVDKSCLDKVSKTHSIREMCRSIKRELIEEQLELLEGDAPNKKAKTESDSDDDTPLLVLREGTPSRDLTDETERKIVREMVEESSSDDELLNEMFNKQGEERKRGRGSYYAASTIEWSSAFAPALGRVAKRVSLPDIESVRRYNSSVQVAQVAPITSTVGANGDDAMQVGQPLVNAAADDKTEVWHTLDLPADDELQAALDELTTAPVLETGQQRTHCCAARRHREVNDSRRRIGLAEIPLHNHPEGECTCCCTHLSDADARLRLDQQLRALHQDIEQMLKKAAVGKIQSKPAQKNSRSPSPAQASTSPTTTTTATSAPKQAAKDASSTTATVSKGPKGKPAANTNRPKRSRARPLPDLAPAPPAPPVNDFEEWQRQKSMNAKYFHINSNICSKKNKSTTAQDTAEQSTSAQSLAIQKTTAQGHAVQSTITQHTAVQSIASRPTVIQSSIVNRTSVQSTAAKRIAVQSTTSQATAVQSTTVQITAVQSTTALSTAVQSTGAKRTAVQSTTLQAITVQSTTAQDRVVQSTSVQGTAVQSTASQATVVQSTTPQGRAVQSTTPQTAIQQRTIAQSGTPTQNVVESGLMPYIRHSRLVSPPEEPPRVWRTVPIPSLHGLTSVAIAPKPAAMRHASLHAQQYTVVDEPPATTSPVAKKDSKKLSMNLYQSPVSGPRRMNLTTEQVSEPAQPVQVMTVNSGPTDTPMSILEEYSRTLSIEPVNNTPVVNALSLRVPGSGPQGPKTTIVMALTLPSDEVIKQTINRLYANDMVDLTEEPETPESVNTNVPKQKTSAVDLIATVKSLMKPANKNSARSFLKPATATESGRSLLKSTIMSAIDTVKPPATEVARDVTSLSYKVHDGDVIEIDDSDSNHSNGNDGNQSGNSNKSSIFIKKSSKPAVYSNKSINQAKSVIVKESSDQTTSRTDEGSNQAASNGNEAVSKTNEGSSQASTTNSTNQAIDNDKSAKKTSRTKKPSNERNKTKYGNAVFKKTNVSVDAVNSHSVSRPCSRIPVLTSLTDGSLRCPARFANVAALTDFMTTLRKAAAQANKEVYCHKWSAVEQPVSALPCGGTLLRVDGSQPPLVLPTRDPRDARGRRNMATPHARAHLVLTEADPPCALPTYWTLSAFGLMARVVPDEPPSTDAADRADAGEAAPSGGGACWCPELGKWITPKEDRKICEKNHNFKILTAFCSADGVRQAARAGASLLLLSVLRARVVVLTLQRQEVRGVVRHRASADVDGSLLRELESLLDEAEIDEQLGGRADITDSETAGN